MAVDQFGVSLCLTTYWIYLLYGASSYPVLLYSRLAQSAVLAAVEVAMMLALTRGSLALRRRLVHNG